MCVCVFWCFHFYRVVAVAHHQTLVRPSDPGKYQLDDSIFLDNMKRVSNASIKGAAVLDHIARIVIITDGIRVAFVLWLRI